MNMQVSTPELLAPPPLRKLSDTGLTPVMMRDIVLKTVFRKNVEKASEIAQAIALPIPLTQELIDNLRDLGLMQATGTLHATSSSEMGFQLTDGGKARALDALSQSEYYGPMPVPLEDYKLQVKRQSIRDVKLTRDMLERSMGHLILPRGLIDQLGPAVGSGRSVLMYGPPGNGKSSIAEGIRAAMGDSIYIPHALSYAGQVITMFDPIVHTPVKRTEDMAEASPLRKAAARFDTRYLLCTRPTVMTGGELTLSMLDLNYFNAVRPHLPGQPAAKIPRGRVHRSTDHWGRQRNAAGAGERGSCRWNSYDSSRCVALKFEVPFRHAGRFLTQLPRPTRFFNQGRPAADLLQGEDRRPDARSSFLKDLRHLRPRQEEGVPLGRKRR